MKSFFSYAREDQEFVRKIADNLKKSELDLWWDEDIQPGSRWDKSIENALKDCEVFIVALSKSSVSSPEVLNEANYAINKTKIIIPLLIEDCETPYRLSGYQWIDFRKEYALSLELLINTIKQKTSSESINIVAKDDKPATLIMKGGGIKGLAYVGALEILNANGYNFTWFAGTSAGAISAALMGVGYSHEELKEILTQKDFNEFKDANIFCAIWNLFTKKGLYQANTFTIWIDRLLAHKLSKPNRVLFNDLKKKEVTNRITIYASRRGTKAQIFDSKNLKELSESESPPIAFAVRSSMAIPFIFTPTLIHGYKTVDGGMQNNYPVNALLEDNPSTKFVGLYLGPEIYEGEKPKSLILNLFSILTESNDEDALREHEEDTIVIDTRPISTLDFKLSEEEKQLLLEAGRLSALRFINKKKGIKLSEDYNERKKKHEANRNEITKKRKVKKRKRVIKTIMLLAIIILVWFYYKPIKCWVSNFFPSYRTSLAGSVSFNPVFLKPKDTFFNEKPYMMMKSPLKWRAIRFFVPEYFTEVPPESLQHLIKSICISNNKIQITLHFSKSDTNYAGFKFKIGYKNIITKSGDEDFGLTDYDKIWQLYTSDISIKNPNYEFLLANPIKEGDYNFQAKINNQ